MRVRFLYMYMYIYIHAVYIHMYLYRYFGKHENDGEISRESCVRRKRELPLCVYKA